MRDDERDAQAWLDQLLDGDTSPEQRADIESRLRATEHGRQLLALLPLLASPPPPPPDGTADLAPDVLARLPRGRPGDYRRLADLVLRAWQDTGLRERLRAAPREQLRAAGLTVPDTTDVAVVTPAEAELPTSRRVVIPLPPPGAAAVPSDEARAALSAGPFGWLWGPPWEPSGSAAPIGRALVERWRAWFGGGPVYRPVAAALAAVLAVAGLALLLPGVGTPGAAVGDGQGPAVTALLVVASLLALLALLRPGR
jgi:hypothetical protein